MPGPRLLALILCLAANSSAAPNADSGGAGIERIFDALEQASPRTRRQPLEAGATAPVDLAVFTRLQRRNSNGRISDSNAVIVAANSCHLVAAAAGHSVLDHRYDRPVARGALRLLLPDGQWATADAVITPPDLHWDSDERNDWALLVVRHPDCSFAEDNHRDAPHPYLPTGAISRPQLQHCRDRGVQLLCHHFDQGRDQGRLMREVGCALQTRHYDSAGQINSTGYFSCKVDGGASGCAVLCEQGDRWINLGIFSRGLQRHDRPANPQPAGAFRVYDGELWQALKALKEKYGME